MPQGLLRNKGESGLFALLVVLLAVGLSSTVVLIILSQSKCEDGIFSMEKTAFLLQLLHPFFEDILNGHQFFILFDCVIECLLQQLIVQLFLLKQANKLSIGLYLPAHAFLVLLLFLLVDTSNEMIDPHLIFLLILLQDIPDIWMLGDDNVFHFSKQVEVLLHFLALALVVILFLNEISDELIDVLIAYFLLEAMQFIVHGWLRKILILLEPLHNRSKGLLLIMQVLPQIHNLVLKLAHPFMVELFVLQSHLLLHQQSSIDVHVLVVVFSQFTGELCLGVEQGEACFVAAHNCKEGLLIESQILLEVGEIVVAFDSLSLQELDFVLLALVGSEELLHIVDVAVTHWIIQKNIGLKPQLLTDKKRPKNHIIVFLMCCKQGGLRNQMRSSAIFYNYLVQLMHRERSESTNRDKLSLRNLLNLQFQSQYKSTTLEARPKTMYNQRQMKIFQDDRVKLMSEQKLRRNNSQQLTKARPTTVLHSEDKLQKNKLKHALGKINILADGDIAVEEQQRIGSIYRFFECLSKYMIIDLGIVSLSQVRTQNFYQKAFNYIYESYNDIVYINRLEWPQEQLNFLANLTRNEMLIRLNNGVKDITYKQLASELFKQMRKKLIEVEEYRATCESKFSQLEGKISEKNHIIKKLSSEVYFYEEHPSKEQYGYIAELQQKNSQLQQQLKKGKSHIRQLQNSIQYLTQYNNMLNQRVEELRIKIYDYQIVQFSNLKEIQKNSDLKEFQNNVELLKDLIQKGALRMASMREEYNKIDAYNQQLLGERSVLAKRAAVGFAELTPRPNYKKIFTQYGLDYEKMMPEKQLKPTTEELVTSIIKKFKEFYNKHVRVDLKLEIPDRSPSKKGPDPGQSLLQDITKMSKQLRKVQNLSIDVKTGYNKQKQEQELLNKRNKK